MKAYLFSIILITSFTQISFGQDNPFLALQEIDLTENNCELEKWYEGFKKHKKDYKNYKDHIELLTQKINNIDSNQCIQSEQLDTLTGRLYYHLGIAYRKTNLIEQSHASYNKALEIFETYANSKILAITYRKLGKIWRLKKDFTKANDYFENSERICLENKIGSSLHRAYQEMITNYLYWNRKEDTLTVNEIYLKAKAINHPKIKEEDRLGIETNRALIYWKVKNYNKALDIYIDSEVRYRKLLVEYRLNKSEKEIKELLTNHTKTLLNIAKLQFKLSQFDKADERFTEIEELIEKDKVYSHDKHFYQDYLTAKAVFYEKQNQFENALEEYQKILKSLSLNFTYQTIYQNPSPNQIVGNPYLLTTLADKAEIFKKMYAQTSNKTNLTQALNCYELSYAAADEMRKNYSFENANTYLSDYTYSYYEKAIELCQTLAEVFPEQQNEYQQKAFEIAQRSSMKTLFWKINSKYAEKNLPQATKIKLNVLRKDITDLERKIDEDLNNNSLKTKRFETQQELEATINIAQKLTVYNKFKPNLINQKKMQTNLNSNQALLNYFVGDSLIYCFLVTKNKFQIIEIENPKVIIKKVVDFRNAIDANEIANDLAHQLYQQLLQNILTEFPNQINSLIIIPDGILSALPFEALQKTNNYNDYLLKHYTISYDLHSYFLTKTKTQSNPIKISAASFSVEDFSNWESMQLPYLPNSKKETDNLNSFVKGATFPQATKQQFLQHFSNASIVHVSSHAQADTLDAANSCIIFSRNNEAEIDDLLTRDEILNYKCTAEMIVLSACETGVGKLNKGEGIASLARAFRTIGSKSEVMSLWKIYDGTTAIIMTSFYKFLKKGYPKNKALQKAKLQYLKNQSTDSRKHPKNWAGLVLQGNVEALF